MSTKWALLCLGFALPLRAGHAEARTTSNKEPPTTVGTVTTATKNSASVAAPSAAPIGAVSLAKSKQHPKPASRPAKARAPGPPRPPNEAVRRAVAGATSDGDKGGESPELSALRETDRELFPPAGPPPSVPWSSDLSVPLSIDGSEPVVRATGLPPTSALPDPVQPDAGRDLGWLRALQVPELPVRWDARLVRYLDYYRDDPRGRALVQSWIKKSGRYGAVIRRALREQGLPEDLIWVSLVESGFDPQVRSPAGAAGLWQLMPEGARVYGLVVDRWIDERLDPERSTQAAARYLFDLHRRFGAWELALAAYNMGYGGLLAAIRKYNTNDFWELVRVESGIPYETALYVPKIIALSIVARNPVSFGIDGTKIDPPVQFDQAQVPSGVTIKAIAAAAGVDATIIDALNPQLRAGRTPPEAFSGDVPTWVVRVPEGKGAEVTESIRDPGAQDKKLERYLTKLGDSIDSIAAARGTSKARLLELNAFRNDEVLRPGTTLLLPPPELGKSAIPKNDEKPVVVVPADLPPVAGKRRVFYRVTAGDTLPEIAAAFRVSADELCRWNALDPAARLHEGMTLQVFPPESADLSKVVCLTEGEVRCLSVGSEEFFAHFEGLKGRKRTTVTVQDSDTWEKLAKRYGLTLGQLERINQRPRSDKLRSGDSVVVYVPADSAPHSRRDASSSRPSPARTNPIDGQGSLDVPAAVRKKLESPKAP